MKRTKLNNGDRDELLIRIDERVTNIYKRLDSHSRDIRDIKQILTEGEGKIAKNREAVKDIQKLLGGVAAFFTAIFVLVINKIWR